MRFQILNRRVLSLFRPGVSIYNPEHYNETILIPLDKINYVTFVKGVVQIGFGTQTIDYIPDSKPNAEAAFKELQFILSGSAEELK